MKVFYILTVILLLFFIPDKSDAQDTISPPNPGGVTKVYVSMIINNIFKVDAARQIITADVVITARWNDPRLKHDASSNIIVTEDKIWDPFLTFSNRLNTSKSFPENFTILNDGTVLYLQRIYGDFTQKFLLEDFPFDEQSFQIRIIDITLNPEDVLLEPDTIIQSGISNNLELSDWTIKNWSFEEAPFVIMNGQSERSSLRFLINAKRESGYYLLIFMIPLILIILMSLMAFWLPANLSASQITVGTTSMLTLIAYRFIVTSELPKISYMTRMDVFILGSSILIFLTLLESVLTSTLANKGQIELAQKLDFKCRWIFPLLYLIIALFALVF
ncbi:MAG TPA: hypothetical protein PKA90_09360 [Ignavibacteria bacterium]|nr:hypothetical protein [Ignavibacteria bacterium]HMR40623.1 hypothetical protein [Ignavibacteria bacterium]